MARLVTPLYPLDAQLSHRIELFLRDIDSFAANLDCIGTDDPAAPPLGSSTRAVLAYLFGHEPEKAAEFTSELDRR
jgi:hypothetical protein